MTRGRGRGYRVGEGNAKVRVPQPYSSVHLRKLLCYLAFTVPALVILGAVLWMYWFNHG